MSVATLIRQNNVLIVLHKHNSLCHLVAISHSIMLIFNDNVSFKSHSFFKLILLHDKHM